MFVAKNFSAPEAKLLGPVTSQWKLRESVDSSNLCQVEPCSSEAASSGAPAVHGPGRAPAVNGFAEAKGCGLAERGLGGLENRGIYNYRGT